jgi:hypothetical protein
LGVVPPQSLLYRARCFGRTPPDIGSGRVTLRKWRARQLVHQRHSLRGTFSFGFFDPDHGCISNRVPPEHLHILLSRVSLIVNLAPTGAGNLSGFSRWTLAELAKTTSGARGSPIEEGWLSNCRRVHATANRCCRNVCGTRRLSTLYPMQRSAWGRATLADWMPVRCKQKEPPADFFADFSKWRAPLGCT